MKILSAAVTVWALCLTPALTSPITDADLDQIRQFAAAAMAKGRQFLRPRLPPIDSQGSFSHYYGRHIPSAANILPPPPANAKPEQFLKVHAAAAADSPLVVAPAPPTPLPAATQPTPDPFQTFEQHMFANSPVQPPPRSQFNHHSFGPFHFFTNKSPPPPPRGPPSPHLRHNQQLQAVMSGQHFSTVAQQSHLRDQQQASLNAQFLPFDFAGKPTQYFGKGKGGGAQPHFPNPFQQRPIRGNFIVHGRPNDDLALIQPHLQPQEYTFTQLPGGVKVPLTVGPETNPFNLPIRFEQVQQMPYAFPVQPQPLHLAMVVQSQEFPQYQFNPNQNFIDPSSLLPSSPSTPTQQQQSPNEETPETSTSYSTQPEGGHQGPDSSAAASVGARGGDRTQKVTEGGEEAVGEIIFESVRQTQQQEAAQRPAQFTQSSGNGQENVFFQAPLVFSQELFSTSTASPPTSSDATPSTTEGSRKTTAEQVAIEFFKAKEVEGSGGRNGGVVTPSTSTSFISSSSKSVSSSVSTATSQTPQKFKRLRKVKVTRGEGQPKTKLNPPK